jgi:hypothetical protein
MLRTPQRDPTPPPWTFWTSSQESASRPFVGGPWTHMLAIQTGSLKLASITRRSCGRAQFHALSARSVRPAATRAFVPLEDLRLTAACRRSHEWLGLPMGVGWWRDPNGSSAHQRKYREDPTVAVAV